MLSQAIDLFLILRAWNKQLCKILRLISDTQNKQNTNVVAAQQEKHCDEVDF